MTQIRPTSFLLATSLILLSSCTQEAVREEATSQEAASSAPASGDAMATNSVANQDEGTEFDADVPKLDAEQAQDGGRRKKFVPPPAKKVPSALPRGASPDLAKQQADLARKNRQADGKVGEGVEGVDKNDELRKELLAAGASEADVEIKMAALAGQSKGNPALTTQVDPNAKLTVDFGKEKFDFGLARQGDILEHTFEMIAAGTSPLRIRQASPTCGCTVGEVFVEGEGGVQESYKLGDPIEPGKKVTITAKLNTTTKRNRTQVRINVYHNDPVGMTQLALTADIEPFITATPPFLNFGDVKRGEARKQTIDIRTARGEVVMLTPNNTRNIPMPAGLSIDLVPTNPDADGRSGHWKAEVTIGMDAKEGSLGYQLALVTDVEFGPELEDGHSADDGHDHGVGSTPKFQAVSASVSARILGALSHTPQFVSMGLVRPGQVVPRTVKVLSHDTDFDLSGVTAIVRGDKGKELAFAEHFSTSVKPSSNGNGMDVELRLNGLPEGADGSFRGELVISTGHEAKPEIIVHFSGVCRAGVRGGR
ncbi:MAG: hypothetical protein ACI8QC_003544 [Planctomycetota bacterium]|jgi:hypothetical protein